ADDDLAKLFWRLESPLRADGVGLLHSLRHRLSADPSRWVDSALLLDRPSEVGNCETEFGQHVRLDPDPHRVIRSPKQTYLPNAGDSVERVVDVDIGVICEEQRVVSLVR